ncbi:unnamed protein product [Sphagnum jensenii]|uniref:Clp R domain-containing protein n=1 Tax=Sphagnum jensenii TaxID=128206 RepID=A0ABP1BEU7_9BRYO
MVSALVQPLHLLLGVVVSSHHAQQLHEGDKKKPVVAQGRIVWSMDFKASGGGSHVQEIHQEGHQGHRVVQEEVLQLGHNFLGHNYIGMEHLLLGLLQEDEGVAAWVLENLGAGSSDICTQAGSAGHRNYHNQADVCHTDQILKKGGLKDENTIVFIEAGPSKPSAVHPTGHVLVDDWDCLKSMVCKFEPSCGPLTQSGMKQMCALANVCNAGLDTNKRLQQLSRPVVVSLRSMEPPSLQV